METESEESVINELVEEVEEEGVFSKGINWERGFDVEEGQEGMV